MRSASTHSACNAPPKHKCGVLYSINWTGKPIVTSNVWVASRSKEESAKLFKIGGGTQINGGLGLNALETCAT